MVVVNISESKLKSMARAKAKRAGYPIALLLAIPHQGAVIGVERIHDMSRTNKGREMYPILARTVVWFADTNYRHGKTTKGIHLEFWTDYTFIGKTRSELNVNQALMAAKKKAYVIAGRIATAGYKFKE